MTRGFEVVSVFKDKGIKIPERKTAKSAGYDIAAAQETYIYPGHMALVPTGLKAYMQDDEYLDLRVRSGLSTKHQIILVNGAAVIDADYYNNSDNEGHICVPLYNLGKQPITILKGERIAQGIFTKFGVIDNDSASGIRVGGFGSTGTTSEATETTTKGKRGRKPRGQ